MKNKIIIALDVDNFQDAKSLVDRLKDAEFFKVGLQSFLKCGEEIITYLHSKKKKLFLDLKFKDIPNTVNGAVKASLKYSPIFLTIHLSGGAEMIKKALEAGSENSDLIILGVTVLTSLSNNDLEETGMISSTEKAVFRLAQLGIDNGIRALVCSAHEIEPIRKRFGNEIILVTPGIRPFWATSGDQKRVFTPRLAMEKGSDYLVIGRPITRSQNPADAFQKIIMEMENSI
jgi:orotidine-5'-phosphate decarboxylase